MIATIIIVSLALAWLGYETDFMTIRLLTGGIIKPLAIIPDHKGIICHEHGDNWKCYELPERTILAYGHTMNFKAGCNRCRAKLLKDIYKAQTSKIIPPGYKRESSLPYKVLMADYERYYGDAKMDISVNDKTLSINGNYKRGIIREFVKANAIS